MFSKRILIVDNDLEACCTIKDYMQQGKNITVDYTASVSEALNSYVKNHYCLVVLEDQLSGISGIEMLQIMLRIKSVPILLLAPFSPDSHMEFFQAGATAIMEKPMNIAIFAAQAEALIRLYLQSCTGNENKGTIVIGTELIIIPHFRQVYVDGSPLSLTRKEFDLLCFFASHPHQVFSREQLYSTIWGNGFEAGGVETVRAHIHTLRKKLELKEKNLIHNVWGVGYKFVPSNCA